MAQYSEQLTGRRPPNSQLAMLTARLLGTAAALVAADAADAAAQRRNVLYIVFDDLRPDLQPYGVRVSTPHIQRLADTGVVFDRAFVQISVCSPSRMSFSTGRRPNATQTWNFINHFREARCASQHHVRVSEGVVIDGGFQSTGTGWGYTRTGGYAQCCTSCTARQVRRIMLTFGCTFCQLRRWKLICIEFSCSALQRMELREWQLYTVLCCQSAGTLCSS